MATAVFRDPIYLAHDPGHGHPENPRRLDAVYRSLDASPIEGLVTVAPRRATRAELAGVHDAPHIEQIERTAALASVHLDPDTATCPASYEASLRAAGATVQAVEMVVAGEADGAFALVRPPGHHAERQYARGFCLFNNVAVAAQHAVTEGGLSRVLVLDPDVHHGNGTEHTFYDRADVLYVSSHRYPFFPGTGSIADTGEGRGRGHTVNLALPAGLGDADFLYLYRRVVEPIVDAYRPQLILVSAGFDTWARDPLGGMAQSEAGFRALYGLFRQWADRHCPGRMVCALEGGYDPVGVVAGARAALDAMAAPTPPPAEVDGAPSEAAQRVAHAVTRALANA